MKQHTFITGLCAAVICLWGATACTDTSEEDLLLKSNTTTHAVQNDTPTIDITLTSAGTLAELLNESHPEIEIKRMAISGPINADDLLTIRSLRNTLEGIDLSYATIVGSTAIDPSGNEFTTEDNAIPEGMFQYMLLSEIVLPENITKIGSAAFCGVNGSDPLHMTIPESVTAIGGSLFMDCTNLASIHWSSSLQEIPYNTFWGCRQLSSVTNINRVRHIQERAFHDCPNLREIQLPECLQSIGHGCFGESGLTSITLPDSVKLEDQSGYMFEDCLSLQSISLPQQATIIPSFFLTGCDALQEIDIPSTVTYIGDEAFSYCHSLTSIEIPAYVTWAGTNIFTRCENLTFISWETELDVPRLGHNINPNCLMYIASENTEAGNSGLTNIIRNGVAETIELTSNGHAFNVPQAFKAKSISFIKAFYQETWFGTSDSWETIALPFTPTLITAEDGRVLAPFNSEVADAKPFWLRRMTSEGFVNTPQLEAGVPYLIAMPNNYAYLPEYNISGNVTFSAQSEAGIDIPVTETQITCDQGPKFSLTSFFGHRQWTYNDELPDIYLLEDGWFRHVRIGSTLLPFQCYATPNSGTDSPASFAIDGSKPATRAARPLGPVPSIDDM